MSNPLRKRLNLLRKLADSYPAYFSYSRDALERTLNNGQDLKPESHEEGNQEESGKAQGHVRYSRTEFTLTDKEEAD